MLRYLVLFYFTLTPFIASANANGSAGLCAAGSTSQPVLRASTETPPPRLTSEARTRAEFLDTFIFNEIAQSVVKTRDHVDSKLKSISISHALQSKFEALTNTLRSNLEGFDSSRLQSDLQRMPIEEARALSLLILRDLNPNSAKRILTSEDQKSIIDTLMSGLNEARAMASKLKSVFESEGSAIVLSPYEILLSAARIGLRGPDLLKAVKVFMREQPLKDPIFANEWLHQLNQHYIANSGRSSTHLEANNFTGLSPRSLKLDPQVLESTQRLSARFTSTNKHTLRVQEYLERHISSSTMNWLIGGSRIPIIIYGSSRKETLYDLFENGFTEIAELERNRFTDFSQFVARRPDSGETVFVVQTLLGRASLQEAIGHFLYARSSRGTGIDVGRIQVRTSRSTIEATMAQILREENLSPDVIVIGNTVVSKIELTALGGHEVKSILTDELSGKVYELNGKSFFVTTIEPRLFGDRAGALVKAVIQMRRSTPPTIIFTGTAGSLSREFHLDELVIPTVIQRVNELEPTKTTAANSAVGLINSAPGIHVGRDIRHGSVDTILYEDQAWFDQYSKGPEQLDVVEQELFDVFAAATEGHTKVYAALKISDELYSGLDFSANETNRIGIKGPNIGTLIRTFIEHALSTTHSVGRSHD